MSIQETFQGSGQRLGEIKDQAVDRAKAVRDAVGEGLSVLDERTRGYVEEHPFMSLGIALATGFIVGRLVARL